MCLFPNPKCDKKLRNYIALYAVKHVRYGSNILFIIIVRPWFFLIFDDFNFCVQNVENTENDL